MRQATLIVLGGFAGAGKSTIARRLARENNVVLFSSDDVIAAIQQTLLKDFHEAAPIAYDVLWHLLHVQLKHGLSVVFDSNMCHERTWQQIDRIQHLFPSVRLITLILECPLEVHRTRIEQRALQEPEHNNLGGDAFDTIAHKYEFIRQLNRPGLVRIDANRPLDDVYVDVCQHIAA